MSIEYSINIIATFEIVTSKKTIWKKIEGIRKIEEFLKNINEETGLLIKENQVFSELKPIEIRAIIYDTLGKKKK